MSPAIIVSAAAQSPEDVFGTQYIKESEKLSATSSRLDKLDDGIQKFATPTQQAQAFYSANKATFNAASEALVNINQFDVLQHAARDVLAPVKKIIEGLDALSNVHPFVKVGVVLFRAIVEIEIKRRENDKRTLSLVLQMADMMGTLLQLKDVQDPELETDTGDSVAGRIQLLMSRIETDVKQCGAVIDTYLKQRLMAKFFKAPIWSEKLLAIGKGLSDRKAEVIFALTIHTAIGVDSINAQMKDMYSLLQQAVRSKSSDETEWEREIEKLGGRQAVLDDPVKRNKIAKLFPGELDSNALVSQPPQGKNQKGTDTKSLAAKQAAKEHELTASVETLIAENMSLYERALDAHTEQIMDSISRGTTLILKKMTSGPHERLKHPVMRHLWEDMKWRPSVKARTFVSALLDFYIDQYVAATSIHEDHISNDRRVDSPAGSRPTTPISASDPTSISPELLYDPELNWCMQYLTVSNAPVLMEAFDDDGSGWVKIKEVNDFTAAIPKGLKLIEYLAYRSAGWELETVIFCRRIIALINELVTISVRLRIENVGTHISFAQHSGFGRVYELVMTPAERDVSSSEGLASLVGSRIEVNIERWESLLKKGKFEIDSTNAISQISGGKGIEYFFFPMVYVLLRHHVRIARTGITKVLDENELWTAQESLAYVIEAVRERKKILEATFRQQRQESSALFKYFANGFFEQIGAPDVTSWSDPFLNSTPTWPEFKDEVERIKELSELTLDELKYTTGRLNESGYEAPWPEPELSTFKNPKGIDTTPGISRAQALWKLAGDAVRAQVRSIAERYTWSYLKQRRDYRLEYLKLDHQWKRHEYGLRGSGTHADKIAKALTDEEDTRLTEIERAISQRDYDFWWSMTSLMFSTVPEHNEVGCDGCGCTPLGTRYRCVQCSDFDYCQYCYADPPMLKLAEHKIDHDMIKIPRPLPRGWTIAYKKRARQEVKERAERVAAGDNSKKTHRVKRGQTLASGEQAAEESDSDSDSSGSTSDGHELMDDADEESKDSAAQSGTIATPMPAGVDAPAAFTIARTSSPTELSPAETDQVAQAEKNPEAGQPNIQKPRRPAPVRRPTFLCKAGCGRDDLTLHYLCLDCENDYTLCPDCDKTLSQPGLTQSNNVGDVPISQQASENLPAEGDISVPATVPQPDGALAEETVKADAIPDNVDAPVANGEGSATFTKGNPTGDPKAISHEDGQKNVSHSPDHVVLIIKELTRQLGENEEKKELEPAVVIAQLKDEVSARLGSMDHRVDQLETKMARMEDILLKMANHMGILGVQKDGL